MFPLAKSGYFLFHYSPRYPLKVYSAYPTPASRVREWQLRRRGWHCSPNPWGNDTALLGEQMEDGSWQLYHAEQVRKWTGRCRDKVCLSWFCVYSCCSLRQEGWDFMAITSGQAWRDYLVSALCTCCYPLGDDKVEQTRWHKNGGWCLLTQ